MELESMIVLFIEKRKELNQSLAKVEALTRQLEELKSGINGSSYRYINPTNKVSNDKFDDLEKLRQELAAQTRLNDQQNVTLMQKQNLLMQRKCEIAGIDERIAELQRRLAMKRMLNQQLSSQMKSRTGVAYGLPNDSLNSGNPRLRSSVGPCNTIRLTNSYNRNNINTNVAAVEPFQRSTTSNNNNYDPNAYDKSEENLDNLADHSPSKQHNMYPTSPYRNSVEINSSSPYPPSTNLNIANTNAINNKNNCALNSQLYQRQHQLQQQQQHHQQQQQQQFQSVIRVANHKNMSLTGEIISHTESPEQSSDGNGTCELVKPQSDVGAETFISPLKNKIHLRERPSPSGSSSSSSDQLPTGYSASKKALDNGVTVNNHSKSHIGNHNHYGSRIDNKIEANCDYYNSHHCSESNGYDDIIKTSNEQLIDSIRKNSRLANQHLYQQHQQKQLQLQQQHQQQSELIEKCVSDLPNSNNDQNTSSLDKDDRSSLSGPSITSSGSNSSSVQANMVNENGTNYNYNNSIINTSNNSQLKNNLRMQQSQSCKSTSSNRLTSNNCSPCRGNYNNDNTVTDHNHHHNDCTDRSDLMINKPVCEQHQYHHHPNQHQHHPHPHLHQQNNSYIRNSYPNNESQIPTSFYDYSPSSSNNIYSTYTKTCTDVHSRNLANDANSSSLSSNNTTSSVPQQQEHSSSSLSSSCSDPSTFYISYGKNGYHHQPPSRESSVNGQKIYNKNNNVDEIISLNSSERLPPTGKESNTSSNNNGVGSCFQPIKQANNNCKPQNHNQDGDIESNDEDVKSKPVESLNDESTFSKGDENLITDKETKQEKDWYNMKRRPVVADNKIEKELDISIAERKPLNFKWPPQQHHQQHAKQTVKSEKQEEGKKVTWAKKRILSKTTDDIRSTPSDSFSYLKGGSPKRSDAIRFSPSINGNLSKHDKDGNIENQKNLDKCYSVSNANNFKTKSSLKKDRIPQKDHEERTRRVSFDPLALLLDAALEGELDLVKKTSKIQDVSAANDEGITALHNTICAGHFEIVKYLVEIGCDVNAPDSDGWTPLHCAASCNNLTMVKYLVEHGACIFATTFPDKETAAQKCEEGEEGFDGCSQYLLHIQDGFGLINDGIVYAVYDYDAQSSDELSFKNGDAITILRRGDEDEKDWWWARLNDKEGYVPRNLLGLYPRVKVSQDKRDAMD